MSNYRKDAIEAHLRQMGFTTDAVGVSALSRELETISAELIAKKYPNLEAEQLLTQRIQVPRGSSQYTWRMYDLAGRAVDMASHMSGAPMSGASIGEQSAGMKHIAAAYGYTKLETESFLKSGNPLDRMRAEAARRAIAVETNRVALLGDSNIANCKGLFNQSGTISSAPAADFLSLTASQMLTELFDLAELIPSSSQEIEAPDTFVLSPTFLRKAKRTMVDTSYGKTVLEYFLDLHPEIRVMSSRFLEDIDGAGHQMAMAFNSSQVAWLVGYSYEEEAPEKEGFSTKINASAHVGGVITAFPKSIHYKTET